MDWSTQPATAAWVSDQLRICCQASPSLNRFAERLASETGTTLLDFLDALVVPATLATDAQLQQLGFAWNSARASWTHAGGLFPQVVRPDVWLAESEQGVVLRVESLADFQRAYGKHLAGETLPFSFAESSASLSPSTVSTISLPPTPASAFQVELVHQEAGVGWWVVERHGYPGAQRNTAQPIDRDRWQQAAKLLGERPRRTDAGMDGYADAEQRLQQAQRLVGAGVAADLFFALERSYWQQRNWAGRWQKARQDQLGVGWANHDHHTYRCSRTGFARLVHFLELLGMECRERFYAGAQAGWGAQVLEHAATGVVVFADVDLSPEEVSIDFAHAGLGPRPQLGTVGLWCALHGESFLAAGLHHLECQFDFDLATAQLAAAGIPSLPPFTDLPYLKQAFTVAELWQVPAAQLETALSAGWIDSATAERFRTSGAFGSHLEILQRHQGYKGFNQHGISDIIRRTDPRGPST